MLTIKNPAVSFACAATAAAVAVLVSGCSPSGPEALRAGKDLLEQGRTADAVQRLLLATELMRSNATAWNYLGLAHHCAGDFTNALHAYHRALKFNPALAEARYNLGCLYLDNRRPELATNELIAFTVRRPQHTEGWLRLGTAQLRTRNSAGAERSFSRALQLSSNHVEALNGLGIALDQRNRANEASRQFQRALAAQQDYAPAVLNLAIVQHRSLNNASLALTYYRAYLALRPRPPAYAQVEMIAAALTAQSAARLTSTNAATVPPATNITSRATTNLASTPQRTPAPQTPSPDLRPATPEPTEIVRVAPQPQLLDSRAATQVVEPTNPVAHTTSQETSNRLLVSRNESASVPAPTGTIPAALRYKRYIYTASIPTRGDRNAALPKFNEGLSAQRAKDLSAAITAYREAIQKDPAFYEAHFNLGVAAYDHGQISASLSAYEMALTLRPDSRDARYNFALALRAADYPLDALDELKKLTAWNAEEARVHFTLGNLYAQQLGQPSLARQHYERVLALEPNHPQAGTMRTWIAAQSR